MCDNLYYSPILASKLSERTNNNCRFLISQALYYSVCIRVVNILRSKIPYNVPYN